MRLLGVVAVLVLGASCAGADTTGPSEDRVARIIDGDTLALGSGDRVRLLQIDAPERGEECYAEASARELARLAPAGTRVALELDPLLDRVDRFGRLLRYVRAGGRNTSFELVRRGAATPYFYRGDRGRYAAQLLGAVREARRARRGMWGACLVSWSPTRAVETRPR